VALPIVMGGRGSVMGNVRDGGRGSVWSVMGGVSPVSPNVMGGRNRRMSIDERRASVLGNGRNGRGSDWSGSSAGDVFDEKYRERRLSELEGREVEVEIGSPLTDTEREEVRRRSGPQLWWRGPVELEGDGGQRAELPGG
jgi:hypothetical protein